MEYMERGGSLYCYSVIICSALLTDCDLSCTRIIIMMPGLLLLLPPNFNGVHFMESEYGCSVIICSAPLLPSIALSCTIMSFHGTELRGWGLLLPNFNGACHGHSLMQSYYMHLYCRPCMYCLYTVVMRPQFATFAPSAYLCHRLTT